MKIAIDGPSGAGKSTVAKLLAEKLSIVYLDTGAMYRAVALKAHRAGIDVTDEDEVEPILNSTVIDIRYAAGTQKVILDGDDVSDDIRQHQISKLASDISALHSVRLFLVELQRSLANRQDCVLDGRDIGTFVLPDAEFKFYLTASLEERAKRRYLELTAKGQQCEYDDVKDDIEERDYNDSNRDFAPLKKADDALEIDSTYMSAKDVANLIYSRVTRAKKA